MARRQLAGASKVASVQIYVRAVTGLGIRSQKSCVASPLLPVCQSRHPAVVIAVVDSPVLLVKPLLPLAGGPQILISLLQTDVVDGDEMIYQLCMPRIVADKQDMFDVVAVLAQGLETSKPLASGFFVVLPDFVAVQDAFSAAYLAAVSGTLVN